MEFLKCKTKRKTKKENRIGRKEGFQRQAFRGNKILKTSKLQENGLFGPLYKTQAQKHGGKKTKSPKNKKQTKKTPFCILANSPFFGKFLFFSRKLCFAEGTIKIVFSAEHSFQVSQIVKPPFEAPSPKWHFCNQKCHFGFFPCAC